jgi:DsbC/DsbD-like thiol-disulfide interchange protein
MRCNRLGRGCGGLQIIWAAATVLLLALTGVSRAAANSVVIKAEDVAAKITLPQMQAHRGAQLAVVIDFEVGSGWHIYGAPLPPEYTVTTVKFDDRLLQSQTIKFPPPTPLKFEALNQTFPVYSGKFEAHGKLGLKSNVAPGDYKLAGTIEFQQCNDLECKIPQSVHFELPLKIV